MIERRLEQTIFASRWLMAPFYLGLVVALLMLMIKFVQELIHFAPLVLSAKDTEVILAVLTLIISPRWQAAFTARRCHRTASQRSRLGKHGFAGPRLRIVGRDVVLGEKLAAFLARFPAIGHVGMARSENEQRFDIDVLQRCGKKQRQIDARACALREHVTRTTQTLRLRGERRRRIDVGHAPVLHHRGP